MQLENGGSPQRIPEILWEDGEVRNDEEVEKLLEEIKKGQGQNFLPAMEQQIKFALKYRMSKEGIEALCQTRKPKMAEIELFRTVNVLFGAETSNSLIGKKCTIKQLGQFLTEQMIRKEFEENLLIKRLAEEADTARRQARELAEKFEETKESLKGMLEEARQETVQRDIEIMVKKKTEPLNAAIREKDGKIRELEQQLQTMRQEKQRRQEGCRTEDGGKLKGELERLREANIQLAAEKLRAEEEKKAMEKELELLRNLHETAMEERDYWIEKYQEVVEKGMRPLTAGLHDKAAVNVPETKPSPAETVPESKTAAKAKKGRLFGRKKTEEEQREEKRQEEKKKALVEKILSESTFPKEQLYDFAKVSGQMTTEQLERLASANVRPENLEVYLAYLTNRV